MIELFFTTQQFEQVDQYLAMATGEKVEPIEGSWEMVGTERIYYDSYGYWNLIGIFTNNFAEAHPGVVIGWMTDADGNLLDVAYSYSPLTVIQSTEGFAFNLYNWSRLYDLDSIANATSLYDFMVRTQPFIGADQYEVTEIALENINMELIDPDVMYFTGDITSDLGECDQIIAVAMAYIPADFTILGYGEQYVTADATSREMYITYDTANQDPTRAVDMTLLCEIYLGE